MVFAAGLVPDTDTRDVLLSKAQSYIQNGPIRAAWGSLCVKCFMLCLAYLVLRFCLTLSFETVAGNTTTNTYGRPSVGGVYALLARE
jgi:hypothetical protein